MTNKEIKERIIQSLYNRGGYIRQVDNTEYQTRCPYCGDSEKNLNTGHLYIRIDPDDNLPIVWHCFKCEEKGVANKDFLSMLNIDDVDLKTGIISLNKTSDKIKAYKYYNNIKSIFFDYKLPEVNKNDKKIKYIENRLGVHFNDEDIKDMKIITSLREFLLLNDVKTITCKNEIAYRIEDHFVGFLSYGNSHILFRDITNKDFRWIKYPITEESKQNRIFYSIASAIDIFTSDKITINLAEGVMDIISAKYNLDANDPNTLNIAVCGKMYVPILSYLTEIGFVGDNVTLNIYSDNDAEYNMKKNSKPTTIEYFQRILKRHKNLYGEVNIYYNILSKDIGVTRDKISLKKYRL